MDTTKTSAITKRIKQTDRHRTICGTDWPFMHILEGNPVRGYTVFEDFCNRNFAKRRTFRTLARAEAYFATLDGTEV